MALDKSPEDARPFIERAKPEHPSVIDTGHIVADLFHMINVPTMIWIDEQGKICRPNDSQFGTDLFTQFTRKKSAVYLDMIRAWVKDGSGALDEGDVKKHQKIPTPEAQLARAERAVAWLLHRRGKTEAAARHFDRAAELAPHDWTIRRGAMPIRGINPMGSAFFELVKEGYPEYPMESVTPTRD